ncbi:MAG: hypothetical protein J7578_24185 [Chitinophagaceae bacterium]|nr:hypothetical protein [Chitinophagaceae bacterium]
MSNYTEELRLNQYRLELLTEAYSGYAYSLSGDEKGIRPGDSKDGTLIAGGFLSAAVYCSLYDQETCKKWFRYAADAYAQLGQPFWKLVAVCGDWREMEARDEFSTDQGAQSIFYELVWRFARKLEVREFAGSIPDQYRAQWVGRLGMPLQVYIDLVLVNSIENRADTKFQAMERILQRSTEHTSLLQSDRYHWEKQIGALPYEPEVLACCVAFLNQVDGFEAFTQELRIRERNTRASTIPLRIAAGILGLEIDF